MSLNRAQIIGRLGTQPELTYSKSGIAFCSMSVATSDKWKDKSGASQEKTEWHRLKAFGKTAELCSKYLNKGSNGYFEGKLETQAWEDKDGIKRYTTNIIVDAVQFLDSKKHYPQDESGEIPEKAKEVFGDSDNGFSNNDCPF